MSCLRDGEMVRHSMPLSMPLLIRAFAGSNPAPAVMKKCSYCNQFLDESYFGVKYTSTSGKTVLQSICKSCNKDYQKNHYKENKTKYIDKAREYEKSVRRDMLDMLSNSKCIDCGNNDIRVLEFDHVADNKAGDVSMFASRSNRRAMLEEISKCEVVCANCHRIRTHTRANSLRQQWYNGSID